MAEWLLLLLLVPAIVVPVVLLVGFAGCEFKRGVPADLIIDSADGKSISTITLTWHSSSNYPYARFDIERAGVGAPVILPGAVSPFDDTGLEPDTAYQYRVAGVDVTGERFWSGSVPGVTRSFHETFVQDFSGSGAGDGAGWEGYTLVLRIEGDPVLSTRGTAVRITLYASSVSAAHIDRIYISQPDPTPGANPYDSDTDITKVWDVSALPADPPLVVPANASLTVPARWITYDLHKDKPLLIAVDFSSAPASGIRFAGGVPPTRAVGYWRLGREAARPQRAAGYTSTAPQQRFHLVGKIEVGDA